MANSDSASQLSTLNSLLCRCSQALTAAAHLALLGFILARGVWRSPLRLFVLYIGVFEFVNVARVLAHFASHDGQPLSQRFDCCSAASCSLSLLSSLLRPFALFPLSPLPSLLAGLCSDERRGAACHVASRVAHGQ